jgi:hypothetical protein
MAEAENWKGFPQAVHPLLVLALYMEADMVWYPDYVTDENEYDQGWLDGYENEPPRPAHWASSADYRQGYEAGKQEYDNALAALHAFTHSNYRKP